MWSYAVLATISRCYPPVRGRFLTRYSPVRHWNDLRTEVFRSSPFDLHVLGTPPAFVLSQDQTLKFISCMKPAKASLLLFFFESDAPRALFCFGFTQSFPLRLLRPYSRNCLAFFDPFRCFQPPFQTPSTPKQIFYPFRPLYSFQGPLRPVPRVSLYIIAIYSSFVNT